MVERFPDKKEVHSPILCAPTRMIEHADGARYFEGDGEKRREVVVELGLSPRGKTCVQLKKGDEVWILLSTMYRDEAPDQLSECMRHGIRTMLGLPVDWRKSIREEVIWEIDSGEMEKPVVGIYIPADTFDSFIERGFRPNSR